MTSSMRAEAEAVTSTDTAEKLQEMSRPAAEPRLARATQTAVEKTHATITIQCTPWALSARRAWGARGGAISLWVAREGRQDDACERLGRQEEAPRRGLMESTTGEQGGGAGGVLAGERCVANATPKTN